MSASDHHAANSPMHSRPTLICLALIVLVPRALPAAIIDHSVVIGPGSQFEHQELQVVDGADGPSYVVLQTGVEMGNLSVTGNSSITMLGGDIDGQVLVTSSARFTMIDGTVDRVSGVGGVHVNIFGGEVFGQFVLQNSRNNPALPEGVISGGTFSDSVRVGAGTLLIRGGDLQQIQPEAYGTVEITGGTMTRINASSDSVVHYSGGEITGDFDITAPGGTIHIYGSNLVHQRNALRLDGVLADGTVIDHYYVSPSLARIVLHNVPEPSSFMLGGTMSIPLALYLRCRSRVKTGIA